MHRRLLAIFPLLLLAACDKKPAVIEKVLIGGTTVVSPGAEPIEDSIVIIRGTKIRAVGSRQDVSLPRVSDRTDLTGEWIMPAQGSHIARGEPANLMIFRHAPNGNTSDPSALIVNGEWKVPGAH